jgi:hypothetical protein
VSYGFSFSLSLSNSSSCQPLNYDNSPPSTTLKTDMQQDLLASLFRTASTDCARQAGTELWGQSHWCCMCTIVQSSNLTHYLDDFVCCSSPHKQSNYGNFHVDPSVTSSKTSVKSLQARCASNGQRVSFHAELSSSGNGTTLHLQTVTDSHSLQSSDHASATLDAWFFVLLCVALVVIVKVSVDTLPRYGQTFSVPGDLCTQICSLCFPLLKDERVEMSHMARDDSLSESIDGLRLTMSASECGEESDASDSWLPSLPESHRNYLSMAMRDGEGRRRTLNC